MKSLAARQERTIRLLEQLAKDSPYRNVQRFARKALDRHRMPMSAVLAMVPGDTIVEKARHCGVTRQAYYDWLNGSSRPSRRQADILAGITGLSADAIFGSPGGFAETN